MVDGNKQNAPGGATKQSHSTFPLSYSVFQTERFAEYAPFFVQEGVSGDRLPLHSNHEVQTYTLKSPILQSLAKKKDYFVVPMQAILPLNWEKFFTNPNIGQDVPDDVGLGVVDFWSKMKTLYGQSHSVVTSTLASTTSTTKLRYLIRFLIWFERIYSAGSLMETLGISGHNYMRYIRTAAGRSTSSSFDELFDEIMGEIAGSLSSNPSGYFTFTYGSTTYRVRHEPSVYPLSSVVELSLREAIEMWRDDLSFTMSDNDITGLSGLISDVAQVFGYYAYSGMPTASGVPFNLGRLWAYQLTCAHFFSNDHVDFIYSADLFRQYVREVSTRSLSTGPMAVGSFTVNGIQYQYDALSAHVFSEVLAGYTDSSTNGIFGTYGSTSDYDRPENLNEADAYMRVLFGFNRSLRFMDYFTGSRAYPLAVGDHEAVVGTITPGKLDIVELSKTSMMTKFLMAVNRSGRKFSNYMKELFGKAPAYDYHNPMYLAHTSDLVGSQETDNTGAAQVSSQLAVTSRLRATANRFAFEFEPDRDCIVIGITYYDLPRVYTRATERQNFVVDRFDMFNPYLQFTGDQAIYTAEIGTDSPSLTPFSYTNKDMHYKQRYNQANGGFCVASTGLDRWIFEADTLQRKAFMNISPSFIRSFNSEIDHFYQSLTGYSLGTYFHFIVRYDNRMNAGRPMVYNPTLNV